MKKKLSLLIYLYSFATFFLQPTLVLANPVSSDSPVSATVPAENFYAPNLISPPDNHSTNSAKPTFVWRRPSPLPTSTLDHYDLFIDNVIFAANVPDSLTSQDFYFYTATGSGGYFYITPKQDLNQGYHTWRVAVYDVDGQNASTGDWTFYLDSVAPFISLTQINSQAYNWNTGVSGSIPEEVNRYLNVSSKNPTLKGNVEANANLQISLVCPDPAPYGCSNQAWIINSTDGNWEKQFVNLVSNTYYSVYLSATDATNNSTIFPTFYIRYVTTTTATTPTSTVTPTSATPTMTPLPTLNPSLSPLPTTSLSLTPPPDLAGQITPTPFTSKPPPAPTLPPRQQAAVVEESNLLKPILLVLLIIGLPTHILLNILGQNIPFSFSGQFIFTLFFPFLRQKNSQSRPFTIISFYDPNKLKKAVYKTVTDIKGRFYIPKNIPERPLVIVKKIGSTWKDQLIAKNTLQTTCLNPLEKRFKTNKEDLQSLLYRLRPAPLAIAIITSSISLFVMPSVFAQVYLYLSLQAAYSQYAYPKIVK